MSETTHEATSQAATGSDDAAMQDAPMLTADQALLDQELLDADLETVAGGVALVTGRTLTQSSTTLSAGTSAAQIQTGLKLSQI